MVAKYKGKHLKDLIDGNRLEELREELDRLAPGEDINSIYTKEITDNFLIARLSQESIPLVAYAALEGKLDAMRIFIEKGADPSVDYDLPLYNATKRGHVAVVRELLTHPKVNPCHTDMNPSFRQSVIDGQTDIVRELLKHPKIAFNSELLQSQINICKSLAANSQRTEGHKETVALVQEQLDYIQQFGRQNEPLALLVINKCCDKGIKPDDIKKLQLLERLEKLNGTPEANELWQKIRTDTTIPPEKQNETFYRHIVDQVINDLIKEKGITLQPTSWVGRVSTNDNNNNVSSTRKFGS